MKRLIAYFNAPLAAVVSVADAESAAWPVGKYLVENRDEYVTLEGPAGFVMGCIGTLAAAGYDDLFNVERA